MERTRKQ